MKYPKGLQENPNELPFLTEKVKIGRVEKLVQKDKKKICGKHQSTGSSIKAWFKI